jgi:hypothetical protein
LGQVINQQIKKGCLLLGVVFLLLVAAVVKLAGVVNRQLAGMDPMSLNLKELSEKILNENLSLIGLLGLIFIIIWIYSIIDAFWVGWTIERGKVPEKNEIFRNR